MGRICVFCGSSTGKDPLYLETARRFGELLAGEGIGVVYGGGDVGCMGALADSALAAGGEVIGVIPRALEAKEVAHRGLTALHVVGSMHERKALMAELSDGFAALPGGLGTLEEFFEIATWSQLGLHAKPFALLNVGGFYDHLVAFIDHCVDEGFLKPASRNSIIVEYEPERALEEMRAFSRPHTRRWIDREET
ncbi:TIGR00730 family Rossman fold protein [Geobacter sp. DSM 9736]|uniref:LOG family protein n=1 Tax=Geobacter sp. DSM 9736 TaxID=1277350 RepID=UPI000B50A958